MQVYNEEFYSDELYHHGIKGMKWGVRRNRDSIKNRRQSRRLYSLMKSQNKKLNRIEYQKNVNEFLKDDPRVIKYVSDNKQNYRKSLKKWGKVDNELDDYISKNSSKFYKEAYNKAIKKGYKTNSGYFDDIVESIEQEVIGNDKTAKDLSTKSKQYFNELLSYDKKTNEISKNILGKYYDKPANALHDHDVTAGYWVTETMNDMMSK